MKRGNLSILKCLHVFSNENFQIDSFRTCFETTEHDPVSWKTACLIKEKQTNPKQPLYENLELKYKYLLVTKQS